MLDLGNLKIGITVDSAGAKNELKSVSDSVEGAGGKFAKFGKIAAAGVAGAAVAVAAFATKAVSDFMTVADGIDKSSQKLGLSAEAYQE